MEMTGHNTMLLNLLVSRFVRDTALHSCFHYTSAVIVDAKTNSTSIMTSPSQAQEYATKPPGFQIKSGGFVIDISSYSVSASVSARFVAARKHLSVRLEASQA